MDPEDLFKQIVAGGVAEVDRMVAQKVTENFILDYKLTGRPGKPGGISDSNREIFSKAISGFGNAHGGVIIWGVDCREKNDGEDIPRSIDPIPTLVAFKSALENWTQHATRPVHTGVRHEILYYPDGEKGLIVTYIPEGIEAPYEAQYPAGDEKFYWRTGSAFARVDYGPLSRMFGRSPAPRIAPVLRLKEFSIIGEDDHLGVRCEYELGVRNDGRGFATDVFATIEQVKVPGSGSSKPNAWGSWRAWSHQNGLDESSQLILKPDERVSPGGTLLVQDVTFVFYPPFDGEFLYTGLVGATGSPNKRFRIRVDGLDLADLYYGQLCGPEQISDSIHNLFTPKDEWSVDDVQ